MYVCNVTYFFEAKFFPEYTSTFVTVYYITLHTLVLIASFPFVALFFRRLVRPIVLNSKSTAWKHMWLLPAMFLVVAFIYNGAYDASRFAELQYLLNTLLLSFGSFMVYYVVIRMIVQTENNEKLNHQLELQGEHYKMLREHIAETKTARHDLRHHLSLLQAYIASGENEKLKAYVNEYTGSLPIDTEIMFCENYAVNSILMHYAGIAKNEGIRFDVRLELPEKTGVNDSDLCIVFGNCIENAIEACRKLNDGKFIKINSKLAGKMLAVTIDNSFDGAIKKEGDTFLSLKHAGEGIGISSVKAVAQKYNEVARFEAKDNIFQASVMLRMTESPS
jgi:sensor histidine kinase YesM